MLKKAICCSLITLGATVVQAQPQDPLPWQHQSGFSVGTGLGSRLAAEGYESQEDELNEELSRDEWVSAEPITTVPKMVKPRSWPAGDLNLRDNLTGQSWHARYRNGLGQYDMAQYRYFRTFFRCHDGSSKEMDYRVIEFLNQISARLNRPQIRILSGYRSPSYNASLAQRSVKVAKNSLHMQGMAIDFYVPGVPLAHVWAIARQVRDQLGFGGIGYYPGSGFIHIDAGPVRNW